MGFSKWCFSVGPGGAHMGQYGHVWAHMGPYQPIWAHTGPCGPISDPPGPTLKHHVLKPILAAADLCYLTLRFLCIAVPHIDLHCIALLCNVLLNVVLHCLAML